MSRDNPSILEVVNPEESFCKKLTVSTLSTFLLRLNELSVSVCLLQLPSFSKWIMNYKSLFDQLPLYLSMNHMIKLWYILQVFLIFSTFVHLCFDSFDSLDL
ncbi:hypothetical protein M758_12G144300 [Ceratodon purpureus]|nr:hypothetical protein M758_12G144300 [Ceratodon purpureus]